MEVPRRVQSLRVPSWNIDGFRSRKNDFLEHLPRLDVVMTTIQELVARMLEYLVYQRNQSAGGRGVVLLVKRGIEYHISAAG